MLIVRVMNNKKLYIREGNKEMKKVIIIGLTSLLLVVGCGKKEEDEKDKQVDSNEPSIDNPVNITNEEMIKDQEVETLKFTNTGLVYDGNQTKLTSEVKNTSDQAVELSNVMANITYTDEFGNERVLEMMVYFGESLEPGETRSVENFTDVDLRKSTSIEYKIVR